MWLYSISLILRLLRYQNDDVENSYLEQSPDHVTIMSSGLHIDQQPQGIAAAQYKWDRE